MSELRRRLRSWQIEQELIDQFLLAGVAGIGDKPKPSIILASAATCPITSDIRRPVRKVECHSLSIRYPHRLRSRPKTIRGS